MKKKYSLFFTAFLCFIGMGFGQILTFEFSGLSGAETTAGSNFNDSNLGASIISRGSGLTASANGGRFNATNWSTVSITDAVSNNNYMEFTVTPNSGYQFDISSIYIQLQRSSTGPSAVALRSSVDGYTTNLDAVYNIVDNTSTQAFTFTFSQANSTTPVTYRFYMYAEASGGSGGIGDGSGNDIVVNGSVTSTSTDEVDWANVQFPANGTINLGDTFNVYAQTLEAGLTDSAGQGAGIQAWIGYNTSNIDPSDASWTWVVASYSTDSGNNDEYVTNIGTAITSTGTYYYASKFQLNGGPFKYGGYNGGFWNGTTNVNGVLTVNARTLDWCNLQYPGGTNSITTGTVFDVFAQVYESGVTDTPASQGANIQAWIGYSTSDTNPNSAGWTWIPANYNPLCGTNCGTPENNDEYFVDIGSGLPVGTYYYASRFTIDDPSTYYYGGYNVGGGGFWDGTTYISGILNVTPSATCASESFVNSGNSGSYGTETWTGDDGINWTATDSRTDQDLNGNEAVMLKIGSLTNDSPFPNGCGVITFDYAQIYSGTSTLQVFVNGIQYGGDITVNSTSSTTFSTTVNVTGNVSIELRNSGNRTLINNLSWTCNACATPVEATNFLAANGCGGISLNWDFGCAEEVMLVARQGSAVSAVPSGDGTAYIANTVFGSGTDLATGEYDVYEGIGTSTTITGLTNGATYYFTLFSRSGSTWTSGITTSATYNVNVLNPATFSSYNRCGDIELTWILPACYEEVLVVARDGSAVTATPSGDGSSYTGNNTFSSGTAISAGQYVVFNGTGNTVTVTGLTDGNTYHFEIFTRVGSTWSSGVVTSATASTGGGSGATTFNPGDLVFVGFDSYINGANDKYSILTLVDIGPTTEFIIANLLYEWNDAANVSTGKWYDCDLQFDVDPPYASIQYTGCSDIPKGSIICIETSGGGSIVDISVNGISVYTEFTIDSTNYTAGNISTSNADAMWLMQGTFSAVMTEADGSDNGSNLDRYRTFSGTVFGGLQTKGYFQQLSDPGNNGGLRVSRIHPDIECLYLETGPTSDDKFFGFYYGNTVGTQYEILSKITDIPGYWDIQSGTGIDQQYDEVDFTCNDTFTITSSGNAEGQWIGGVSTDWFDCHNWQNFTVPVATVNVNINSTSTRNCSIDPSTSSFAVKYNNLAECNDLILNSSNYSLSMPDSTSFLDLYGNWTNSVGQSYFNEGNGTVTFKGAAHQRINYGGPPTPPAFQTEEFYNVILDNNFDTYESNDLHVNGDLTINASRRLDVRSGDYVFVNQTVTNNNIFYIEDSASLVQSGNGTNTNIGNIIMDRTANNLQLLDYVYWSSPVNQFNTNSIFSTSSYIYKWETTALNGNGGEGTWISAVGEPMSIGRGYITRVPNSLGGTTLTATFTGTSVTGKPNNGNISVPVYRGSNIGVGNSSGDPGAVAISIYDDNWNLVGNPYPSAISAKDFLTANTNIDGFVCLWRHATQPTSDIDPFYDDFGDGTNYTDSDYVYFNLTGVSTPPGFDNYNVDSSDKYIAAGQSFLVNMLESTTSNPSTGPASETVILNNSMRDIFNDNSQFYRTPSSGAERSRIWLNLYNFNFTAINTILLGYVEGATMERDRLYDAVTNTVSTKIYSLINDEKFIIQGRALPFETTDHIPIGLATSNSGSYYIGLSAVDGLFEDDNQNVYIKDNYLNIIFDISQSPYSFSTEAGEFNDRFEIVFQASMLSTEDNILASNDLTIIDLPDGSVKFKVGKSYTISQVEIIDLLGRTLYTLEGNSSEEIYFLPQLNQSAYIANVTLDNGQTLSKKAIKKH